MSSATSTDKIRAKLFLSETRGKANHIGGGLSVSPFFICTPSHNSQLQGTSHFTYIPSDEDTDSIAEKSPHTIIVNTNIDHHAPSFSSSGSSNGCNISFGINTSHTIGTNGAEGISTWQQSPLQRRKSKTTDDSSSVFHCHRRLGSASERFTTCETELRDIANEISCVSKLHKEMCDMEIQKNNEIANLKAQNQKQENYINNLKEAIQLAIRSLDSETATATYLSNSASKRDLQSMFWFWRCKYLKSQNNKCTSLLLQTYEGVTSAVKLSSLVDVSKNSNVMKALAEVALAEGELVKTRLDFFNVGLYSTERCDGNNRSDSKVSKEATALGIAALQGVIDKVTCLSTPRDTNESHTDHNCTQDRKSSSPIEIDVRMIELLKKEVSDLVCTNTWINKYAPALKLRALSEEYEEMSKEYSHKVDALAQARMAVITAYISAGADMYNITNALRDKIASMRGMLCKMGLRTSIEVDKEYTPVLVPDTDAALRKLQKENKCKVSFISPSQDANYKQRTRDPKQKINRVPPGGTGQGHGVSSITGYSALLDALGDAHHAAVSVITLPPLMNLMKNAVHTCMIKELVDDIVNVHVSETVVDTVGTEAPTVSQPLASEQFLSRLHKAIAGLTIGCFDNIEQVMCRSLVTLQHNLLLRKYLDEHVRIVGPDGVDGTRHQGISNGEYTKTVKLPEVNIHIEPLMRNTPKVKTHLVDHDDKKSPNDRNVSHRFEGVSGFCKVRSPYEVLMKSEEDVPYSISVQLLSRAYRQNGGVKVGYDGNRRDNSDGCNNTSSQNMYIPQRNYGPQAHYEGVERPLDGFSSLHESNSTKCQQSGIPCVYIPCESLLGAIDGNTLLSCSLRPVNRSVDDISYIEPMSDSSIMNSSDIETVPLDSVCGNEICDSEESLDKQNRARTDSKRYEML